MIYSQEKRRNRQCFPWAAPRDFIRAGRTTPRDFTRAGRTTQRVFIRAGRTTPRDFPS